MKDIELIGSSPEVMVKVENGKVNVRPIAGTRRRGPVARVGRNSTWCKWGSPSTPHVRVGSKSKETRSRPQSGVGVRKSVQRRPEQTTGRTDPAAAVLCRIDGVHRRMHIFTNLGEFAEPQSQRHISSNLAAVDFVAAWRTVLILVSGPPVMLFRAAEFGHEDHCTDDGDDTDN